MIEYIKLVCWRVRRQLNHWHFVRIPSSIDHGTIGRYIGAPWVTVRMYDNGTVTACVGPVAGEYIPARGYVLKGPTEFFVEVLGKRLYETKWAAYSRLDRERQERGH